jgi:hypothetical protein
MIQLNVVSVVHPRIARAGYDAMMKGTDHVIAPFTAKLRAALTSVLPESMLTAMARPK